MKIYKFALIVIVGMFSCSYSATSQNIIKNDAGLYGFTINLLQQMTENEDGNFVCSPYGIAALFRMYADGTDGNTLKQLEDVLGVGSAEIGEITKDIMLPSDAKGASMETANMVIYDSKKVRLLNTYSSNVISRYGADVISKSCEDQSTIDFIKQWALENTNGKVQPTGLELPLSPLSLYNIIYFKGEWQKSFDVKDTKQSAFYDSSSSAKTVDMMRGRGGDKCFGYYNTDDFQFVSMPYKDRVCNEGRMEKFSMYVFLPHKGKTICDVLRYLKSHNLEDIEKGVHECRINDMKYKEVYVNIHMPKFEMETEVDVKRLLGSLGVKDLNNVTRMIGRYADDVQSTQNAFIDVNEVNTEAAAVTRAGIIMTGPPVSRRIKNYYFNANRPFLYMIVNNDTHRVFFMGQYVQGTKKFGGEWKSIDFNGVVEDDDDKTEDVIVTSGIEDKSSEISCDGEEVFGEYEFDPSFPGGGEAMLKWMGQNLRYPEGKREEGVQGRVLVTFVVEKDGSLSNVTVMRSVDPALDEEAKRLISAMPRWQAGRIGDKVVRVKCTLPVTFRLDHP